MADPAAATSGSSGAFLPGSVRVVTARWTASSWLARSVLASAMVVVFFLALILAIPMLVLGAAALGVIAVKIGVRRLFQRASSPNGALDGRRNVRVVLPDDHE